MRNSPGGNSTSPQVRIHTEARLVRGENSDSVIRADLFGKYGETQPRNSQGKSSNGFSRGSNEPVTFQRSNWSGNKSIGPVHSENQKMDSRNIHTDILGRTKESGKPGMTWTGQYSQFMHQLERMKQELEAVGEENLELANLISDN